MIEITVHVAKTVTSTVVIDVSAVVCKAHLRSGYNSYQGVWYKTDAFGLEPGFDVKYTLHYNLRSPIYKVGEAYLTVEGEGDFLKNYRHQVVCSILNHPKSGHFSAGGTFANNAKFSLDSFFPLSTLIRAVDQGIIKLCLNILIYPLKVTYPLKVASPVENDLIKGTPDFFVQLGNMLEHELHTDVTIKVKDQTFKAHKAMLATRCEYFARMFDSDMMENRTNEIQITDDYSPEAIRGLLSYIYEDDVPNLPKNAHQLFRIAHAYGLYDLQIKCENYIESHVNMSNIVDTLKLAKVYDSTPLQTASGNFVQRYESLLAEHPEYIIYLIESMSVSNVSSLLVLSTKYDLETLKLSAFKYIAQNLKDMICEPTYRNLYKYDPRLILAVDEFLIKSSIIKTVTD